MCFFFFFFPYSSFGWQPLWINCMIFSLNIMHCLYVFVILAYLLILNCKDGFDIFCITLSNLRDQWKSLVHSRPTIGRTHVNLPIYLPNHIPISMSIVCHEILEVYISYSTFHHSKVQVFLEEIMCWAILRLHVTTCNCNTLQYLSSYTWHVKVV